MKLEKKILRVITQKWYGLLIWARNYTYLTKKKSLIFEFEVVSD